MSWTDEVDVTKDGGVVKKTLHHVDGWETPKEDSTVTVNYVAKANDQIIEQNSGFTFVSGSDEVRTNR